MELWQDGLLAALAAIGLASLLWMIVRAVFFVRLPRRAAAMALIAAQGNGECLEGQVKQLCREESGLIGRILLVDCGLSEEGRRLCRLLARGDRRIQLCTPEEIGTYLL